MNIHPLCAIFPKIDGEEFDQFVENIREFGLQHPIITLDEQILDGQNRYAACIKAGVEPRFEEFTGDDPMQFVFRENISRRHLSQSQRAMIASGLATRNQGYQKKGADVDLPPTIEEAAKMMKVSANGVKRSRRIREKSAELADQVRDGTVTVNAADAVANLSPKKRNAAIGGGPDAVNAAAAKESERIRREREETKRLADEEKERIKAEKEQAKRAAKEAKAKAAREPAKAKEIAALEARIEGMARGNLMRRKLEADLEQLRGEVEAPEIPAIDRLVQWAREKHNDYANFSMGQVLQKANDQLT